MAKIATWKDYLQTAFNAVDTRIAADNEVLAEYYAAYIDRPEQRPLEDLYAVGEPPIFFDSDKAHHGKTIALTLAGRQEPEHFSREQLAERIRTNDEAYYKILGAFHSTRFYDRKGKHELKQEIADNRSDRDVLTQAQPVLEKQRMAAWEEERRIAGRAYQNANLRLKDYQELKRVHAELKEFSEDLSHVEVAPGYEIIGVGLEPPAGDAAAIDWRSMRGELRYAFSKQREYLLERKQEDDKKLADKAAFAKFFRMDEAALKSLLVRNLPGDFEMRWGGVDRNEVAKEVHVSLLQDGDRIAHLMIFPDDGILGVEHLQAPARRQGFGRAFVRNVLELGDAMEIKELKLYAGRSDGAKFWPRFMRPHAEGEMVGGDWFGRGGDWYMGSQGFRNWFSRLGEPESSLRDESAAAEIRRLTAIEDDGALLDALYASPVRDRDGNSLWHQIFDGEHMVCTFDFSNPSDRRRAEKFVDQAKAAPQLGAAPSSQMVESSSRAIPNSPAGTLNL